MVEVVWSVIIMVIICVMLALAIITYILYIANQEMKNGSNDPTESEELLQLPSDGD